MFDWFREVGEELGGIDSMEAKKERLERKESERLNKFIISSSVWYTNHSDKKAHLMDNFP